VPRNGHRLRRGEGNSAPSTDEAILTTVNMASSQLWGMVKNRFITYLAIDLERKEMIMETVRRKPGSGVATWCTECSSSVPAS